MATQSQDLYPGPRNYTESERLRAQHLLFKTYLGFVIAPIDLKKQHLRILDSGTADGYWLADLAPSLGQHAELFGTDTAQYETSTQLPSNVKMSLQNIKDAWPEDWKNSFDLVHQRLVLSNVADHQTAKQAVCRLVELVKPGGWIQLDESGALEGPFQESDTPIDKVFRTMGNFMRAVGMEPSPGDRVKALLQEAANEGLLEGPIQVKTAEAKFGRPAPTREVAEAGVTNIMGMIDAIKGGLARLPNPPMTPDELEELRPACAEQLNGPGTHMRYVAVWAQRSGGAGHQGQSRLAEFARRSSQDEAP